MVSGTRHIAAGRRRCQKTCGFGKQGWRTTPLRWSLHALIPVDWGGWWDNGYSQALRPDDKSPLPSNRRRPSLQVQKAKYTFNATDLASLFLLIPTKKRLGALPCSFQQIPCKPLPPLGDWQQGRPWVGLGGADAGGPLQTILLRTPELRRAAGE